MKAQTTIAAALLALATPLAAQSVEFGPRLGFAYSTVSVESDGPDDTEESSLVGLVAGAFARFRPGKFGLQTELAYVRKGASVDAAGETLDIKLGYLEIPLLLVAPIGGQLNGASGFVYGGPAVALEMGCKGTISDTGISADFDCDDQAFDLFDRAKVDVGATLGAGLRFAMGGGALIADARYTYGFVNLNKESGDKVRNRSAAVSLGYSITR
jgi:hypothetical protein